MMVETVGAETILAIVEALPIHVGELKESLRTQDADEILRFGVTIDQALWSSYRRSVMRKTALINGKVAAIWGVGGPFLGNIGQPWLITSNEVHKVSPLKFARIYQQEVDNMLKLFPKLVNWVDNDYTAAIRVLDIVGFTIEEPEPMGKYNAQYRKFSIEG
ncbi:MAG: phage protein Gp13 family protein [Sterolibacterium sp.]